MTQDDTQRQDGRHAERERIRAIWQSQGAVDRPDLRDHLCFETDLAPDEAIAILNAASPEVPNARPTLSH